MSNDEPLFGEDCDDSLAMDYLNDLAYMEHCEREYKKSLKEGASA